VHNSGVTNLRVLEIMHVILLKGSKVKLTNVYMVEGSYKLFKLPFLSNSILLY
jgi:hypothetical protein